MELSYHGSLGGDPPLGWPESARIAREAGFEAMDLDLESLQDHDPVAVRAVLDEAGIRACACPLPVEMRQDERTFEAGFERFGQAVERAATIGIRTMHRSIPASSDFPAAEFEPDLRRRWKACGALAREHGIDLAVEPLGTLYRRQAGRHEFIWRLDRATEFAGSCGPGIGLLVDSWHWHLAGSTPHEIVDAGDLIVHVHVADVPQAPEETLRDTERVLPGAGVVDFEAFLGALDTAGYEGTVSPEVPGSWSAGIDPLESARLGRASILEVLER